MFFLVNPRATQVCNCAFSLSGKSKQLADRTVRVTLPDRSVPNSDELFVIEYPFAFACFWYFNAFEWGVLQVSSRRSDTPAEERPADGKCVPLLTMSKRISDRDDIVVGNVSELLGAALRLQIFLQDPLVIVLSPLLFALQGFFVEIVRRIESDSVRFRWLFGKKLASFLPRVDERRRRILSDGRAQPFSAADNEPGLPIFADAQPECRRHFVIIRAVELKPRHNYVGHVQLRHFLLRFCSAISWAEADFDGALYQMHRRQGIGIV